MRGCSKWITLCLCMALLLFGCGLRTVDQLYCLPQRSDADKDLQSVIDEAMDGLSYSAPVYGPSRQVMQKADLDGDGVEECLVFAKDSSDKPLKILIFCQLASGYVHMDTIEGYGFAFDSVEFVQIDGQPGLEIVVSRQVSNELMRSVSVYRFASEHARQLLSGSCARMLTGDFDKDGMAELVLLNSGETEGGNGLLSVYRFRDEELQRTSQISISLPAHQIRRAQVSPLSGGSQGLFFTGLTEEGGLRTQVFTMDNTGLACIWQGDSVAKLDDYYVYPEDLDGDGALELPALIPMAAHPQQQRPQHFVRWYAVMSDGNTVDKRTVYMNHSQGWSLALSNDNVERLTVVAGKDMTVICNLDGRPTPQEILTIYVFGDSDWDKISQDPRYIILYEGESVTYAAVLEPEAAEVGITEQTLKRDFYMMRTELTSDEN